MFDTKVYPFQAAHSQLEEFYKWVDEGDLSPEKIAETLQEARHYILSALAILSQVAFEPTEPGNGGFVLMEGKIINRDAARAYNKLREVAGPMLNEDALSLQELDKVAISVRDFLRNNYMHSLKAEAKQIAPQDTATDDNVEDRYLPDFDVLNNVQYFRRRRLP